MEYNLQPFKLPETGDDGQQIFRGRPRAVPMRTEILPCIPDTFLPEMSTAPPPNPPATSLQAYLRGSQTTAGSEHRVVLPRKEKLVPDSDPRLTADRVPSSRFGGVTFILCDWIKVCALSRAGAGYRGCCKQAKRTLLGMWALLRLWTAASLAT